MNCLLGPDMSRILEENCRLPVRGDAATTVGGRPFAKTKDFTRGHKPGFTA